MACAGSGKLCSNSRTQGQGAFENPIQNSNLLIQYRGLLLNFTSPDTFKKAGRMHKYLDIVDHRSLLISILCIIVTFLCIRFDISYDVDLIIFSIAIIFPLVFTIREGFRRRQYAVRLLSALKASMSALYFSLENSTRLTMEEKLEVHRMVNTLSATFIVVIKEKQDFGISQVRAQVREIYHFVDTRRDSISGNTLLKVVRLVRDIEEGIENLHGIKIHGTPVSLRAYCLVFIYIVPFIFTPTLVHNLPTQPLWLVYSLSVLHGFILMSLYNLQDHLEDPFDQIGLDDIKLAEFQFRETKLPEVEKPASTPP